ncbi:alpha/beta hydrolase fold domain-containing protein [Erythrobacter arachoides]|uniref:Alpha/beta hydrolase fold domain-containing protein n=1 Tax=Aurantiacibacter arachoides TaxID=1850444 RepID=A0A845A8E8_9SPHN|nr:alpha/beta hydrolase [Aurantiacibacter arachoides]MXO93819.1 alpha/beta hydrolase fold domain-containing protein [Aurantiacibacter arachoides]GGD46433.1 carboxylesterase [Aurantiacibacter arachoides]
MKFGLALGLLLIVALALSAACSPLTTFNALAPRDPGADQVAQGVAYGPGERQMLDVYAPEGAVPTIGAPVVVFFYGGSWNSGTRRGYDFVGQALASRGFVTVVPDYRLVPDVRYPAFVEDGAAAIRWARANVAQYGGDPDRIVLMGHSAGGYIAAMLAVDDRWLGADRAAVRGLVGLAGPYDFAPFDPGAAQEAFGQWPDPAETQPVTWAGAGDPPALLLTGADDQTVRPRNSHALAQRLRAAGVLAEVREYEGVGHINILLSLSRPLRGRATTLDDASAFIRSVAGPG